MCDTFRMREERAKREREAAAEEAARADELCLSFYVAKGGDYRAKIIKYKDRMGPDGNWWLTCSFDSEWVICRKCGKPLIGPAEGEVSSQELRAMLPHLRACGYTKDEDWGTSRRYFNIYTKGVEEREEREARENKDKS